MAILRDLFLTKRKKTPKKFIAMARGHAPWGLGAVEYFYNLYEYEDGMREYEEFEGGQYHEIPDKIDYSTKAQVKAWIYGGSLPSSVLSCEAFIDEVNKEIKKRTKKDQLISDITNKVESGYPLSCDEMDRELKKALDIQLGRYQNEKK